MAETMARRLDRNRSLERHEAMDIQRIAFALSLVLIITSCVEDSDTGALFYACRTTQDCLPGFVCEPLLDSLDLTLADTTVCKRCSARSLQVPTLNVQSCLASPEDESGAPLFSLSYGCEIDSTSVVPEAFAMHSAKRGRVQPELAPRRRGADLSTPLWPGERLELTATASIRNASAGENTQPWVGRFYAPVAEGSGVFSPMGNLGSAQEEALDVVSGHLNGDDIPDVLVALRGNRIAVWLGGLNGERTWLGVHEARVLVLGDFNGDGDLDLFAGHTRAPAGVWLGDGHGNLTATSQDFPVAVVLDAELGDLDGDGDLDLLLTGPGGSRVWLNDGAGNFAPHGALFGEAEDEQAALGDLDGDGDLDAILAGSRTPVALWLNDGQGGFRTRTPPQPVLERFNTRALELVDVDSDGDQDLVIGLSSEPNLVLFNSGQGELSESNSSTFGEAAGNTLDIALGDANADGHLDLLEITSAKAPSIWLNNGAGRFDTALSSPENPQTLQEVRTPRPGTVGDIDTDGDGIPDSNILGPCPPGFTFNEEGLSPSCIRFNAGGRAGLFDDLDADGDLDVLIARAGSHQVWRNEELFQVTSGEPSITMSSETTSVEFNQSLNASEEESSIQVDGFTMHSNISGASRIRIARPRFNPDSEEPDVRALDFLLPVTTPHPGELITISYAPTGSEAALSSAQGLQAPGYIWQMRREPEPSLGELEELEAILPIDEPITWLTPLDLDGDDDLDLLALRPGSVDGTAQGGLVVWSSQVANARPVPARGELVTARDVNSASRAVVADFDNSGSPDVFVATQGVDHLFFNHSQVNNLDLQSGLLCTESSSGEVSCGSALEITNTIAAAAGDLDNDGYQDVVVIERLSRLERHPRIYFNRPDPRDPGSRVLALSPDIIDSSGSYDVAIGDLDRDGLLDVVVAQESGRHLLLYNTGNRDDRFRSCLELSAAPGDNGRVLLGDIDKDGLLDLFIFPFIYFNQSNEPGTFAAENLPLVSPRELHLVDMNGDGLLDIVYRGLLEQAILWGEGTFQALDTQTVSLEGFPDLETLEITRMTQGDMNRDGTLDLVLLLEDRDPFSQRGAILVLANE